MDYIYLFNASNEETKYDVGLKATGCTGMEEK